MSKTKLCRDCGMILPIEQFGTRLIYRIKAAKKVEYRNSFCRCCMKKRTKRWIEKNKKRYNEYQAKYRKEHCFRRCTRCGKNRTVANFSKTNNGITNKIYLKSICKKCAVERTLIWRHNPKNNV